MQPATLVYHDRYRVAGEAQIVQMLLFGALTYEREDPGAAQIARSAIQSWVDMGLATRPGPGNERLFDPVEVTNFLKQAALDGRDDFWPRHYVRTGQRLVGDFAGRPAAPFTVEFMRTFDLSAARDDRPLRLRAPLPIEEIYGDSLRVTPSVTGDDVSVSVTSGRLEARLARPPPGRSMSLGAQLRFTGAVAQDETPPDPDIHLRAREGLVVVTDRVAALAATLAGERANGLEVVRAFWNYIDAHITLGAVHYDQIDPQAPCDWLLDAGWSDCQMAAALLVALCRSRGMPARIVSGYQLYRLAPAIHYWAEVWLEDRGWTPFDCMSLDLSFGGQDLHWRDCFFGRIDTRIITQRLPLQFTGALGVPMPPAWLLMQTWTGRGSRIAIVDLQGRTVYKDFLSVDATA